MTDGEVTPYLPMNAIGETVKEDAILWKNGNAWYVVISMIQRKKEAYPSRNCPMIGSALCAEWAKMSFR
jgi:hypothetical protein